MEGLDITETRITAEIVQEIRNAEPTYFLGLISHLDEVERTDPEIRQFTALHSPLGRYLRLLIRQAPQSGDGMPPTKFANDNERNLLAILYRRTPSAYIVHLRMLIAETLDLHRFDKEFGVILVQNVVDIEAYLFYTTFTTVHGAADTYKPQPSPRNCLLILLLQTPNHRYESYEEDLRDQLEFNAQLAQHVISNARDPHALLYKPFTTTPSTLMEIYLSADRNIKYQHMVLWLIGLMKEYDVPFVHWDETRGEDSLRTVFIYGSVLHILINNFEERVDTNHPGGDYRILPIRMKNVLDLFFAMSPKERIAEDSMGRTALERARERAKSRRREHPDLDHVIHTMSRPSSKAA